MNDTPKQRKIKLITILEKNLSTTFLAKVQWPKIKYYHQNNTLTLSTRSAFKTLYAKYINQVHNKTLLSKLPKFQSSENRRYP